jgi:hypothetical protein
MDRGATFDDEEGFIQFITENKPKDFKAPRKSRASKKSSEERAESEYDCQLCDARVWNNALGGQCSRKKIEGECICSIHMKESGKNDGCLRNGFVTDDRPTHAYGDETQQMLPWHDVEIPKKTKKTSGGGGKVTRKCSNCGEGGHNKKTCPLLKGDTEETVEKKEKENVDDGWANDTEELSDGEEETVVEEEGKKVEKKEKMEPELDLNKSTLLRPNHSRKPLIVATLRRMPRVIPSYLRVLNTLLTEKRTWCMMMNWLRWAPGMERGLSFLMLPLLSFTVLGS